MNFTRTLSVCSAAAALWLAGCDGADRPAAATAHAADVSGPEVVHDSVSTEYQPLRIVRVAGNLSHPWAIAFLPDGRYLVTERGGRLLIIDNGTAAEVSGVPEVAAQRQGGLLDVVLHPDFEDNGWIYLTWSKGSGETTTALSRARLDGESLTDVELVFEQDRRSEPGRHYGSRLAWLPDGSLLMSIGDRGADPPRAQDAGDHAGTLLRLTETGGVPDDNPLLDHDGALPEIYSYGHRNIQGLVYDAANDRIWVTEHGPRGGDELNLIEAGGNYGWPVATKGRDYRTEEPYGETRSRDGMIDPVYEFLPTLAPSGLALVTSERYPDWQGNLLAGGLRAERIRRVVLENTTVVHEEELLLGRVGRIRDVRESPDGYLYVLSDDSDGGLYRLEPRD